MPDQYIYYISEILVTKQLTLGSIFISDKGCLVSRASVPVRLPAPESTLLLEVATESEESDLFSNSFDKRIA